MGLQVILAVDADFLVMPGLHEKLSGPDAAKALLEDLTMRRQVVVLPAFETDAALGIEHGAQIAIKAQTGPLPPPPPPTPHCSHSSFATYQMRICPQAPAYGTNVPQVQQGVPLCARHAPDRATPA